jgi:hypothetical protein
MGFQYETMGPGAAGRKSPIVANHSRRPPIYPPDPTRELRMFADIRTAARGLLRSPTVAISGILCLALGIGATVAISSAISRALFQRLPFTEPDRLVAIHRTTPTGNCARRAFLDLHL